MLEKVKDVSKLCLSKDSTLTCGTGTYFNQRNFQISGSSEYLKRDIVLKKRNCTWFVH